jgi:multiple sugar transport system ATP-binding protein
MARVELKNVSKVFRGPKREEICAVSNLSLTVEDGELMTVVGPSGCGKTTTLRMIAGLEEVTGGTISIGGIEMNDVQPQDRDVAMVFQRDALYPHLTALENMTFGLKVRRVGTTEIEQRVKEAANILGLARHLDHLPAALSGGQRQRVALGRAIVRQPKVFLFDEPLSNLDPAARAQLRIEIAKLHQRLRTTMIYVTHDQHEAMTLGRRVAVMNEGVLQQFADPITLYRAPVNMFVAGFIGSPGMNFFRGRVIARGEDFVFQENNPSGAATGLRFELPLSRERGARLAAFAEGNVALGIRPENFRLGNADGSAVKASVELAEHVGPETWLHLNTGGHTFIARVAGLVSARSGERIALDVDVAAAHFFNPASERAIVETR